MICTILPEVLHSVPKINVNIEGANNSKIIVGIKNIINKCQHVFRNKARQFSFFKYSVAALCLNTSAVDFAIKESGELMILFANEKKPADSNP